MFKGEESNPIGAGIDRMSRLGNLEAETRELDRNRDTDEENDSSLENNPFYSAEQTPPELTRGFAAPTHHHPNVHLDPVTLAQFEEAFNAKPAQENFTVDSWFAKHKSLVVREMIAMVAQLPKSRLVEFIQNKKMRGQFILSLLNSSESFTSLFSELAKSKKTNCSLPMSNDQAAILFHQMFEEHLNGLRFIQEVTLCDFSQISLLEKSDDDSVYDINDYSAKLYGKVIQTITDPKERIGFAELIDESGELACMFKTVQAAAIFVKIAGQIIDDQIVDYTLELDRLNHSSETVDNNALHKFMFEVEQDSLNTASKSISDIFQTFFPQHDQFATPKSSPSAQSVKKMVDAISTTELILLLSDPKKKQDFLKRHLHALLEKPNHYNNILQNESEILAELMKRLSDTQEAMSQGNSYAFENSTNFLLTLLNKYLKQAEQIHKETGTYFTDNPDDRLTCIKENLLRDFGTSLKISCRYSCQKLWFDIFLRKIIPRICLQDFVKSATISLENGLAIASGTAIKSLEGSITDKKRQIQEIEGRLFKSLKPTARIATQTVFWSESVVEKLTRLEKEDQLLTHKLEGLLAASKSMTMRPRL